MPGANEKITVVHLVSVSYAGSTWVNLLLGAAEPAFVVGEMTVLKREGRGLCKFHGYDCPLWNRFDVNSPQNPFLQVHDLCGKRYLTINSSHDYIADQNHPQIESRFIHLVRDGRAVAASILRKYPDRSMLKAARSWRKGSLRDLRTLASVPDAIKTTVHYENLVADTAGELRRLAAFIGYDYDPAALETWDNAEHYLGGSLGVLKKVADQQGTERLHYREQAGKKRSDWDYYEKTDTKNFVDERWKSELSDTQLRTFGLVAGRMNRKLGYPPSRQRLTITDTAG